MTALHIAIDCKNINMVKILIKNKANVNIPNKEGKTPLHLAISHNLNINLIKILLKEGANINASDGNGKTALNEAVSQNNIPLINLFKKK